MYHGAYTPAMKPLLTETIVSTVASLGYILDAEQLHIGGERALMSAHKLVLTGSTQKDNERVVIKVSLDTLGAQDITREHAVRELLQGVRFALRNLAFPQELFFGMRGGYTISVTEFIVQERVFVDYPLREQFFMILKLFEAQEEFHATTYEHTKTLRGTVPVWDAEEYCADAQHIKEMVASLFPTCTAVSRLVELLDTSRTHIDQFSGFLDHTDLVPHNFRVKEGSLFALDQVAIRFGNKYEMWARFINYMLIHNPELADLLVRYVEEKRGKDDATMLRIMRCYKAGVLLRYYAETTEKSTGDMHELSKARFLFWDQVLTHLLNEEPIPREMVQRYIHTRDTLRSDDEKKRQREFAKA
ncbi:MAG: hypothetical protein RLZZ234_308 [Candidatus Parcubacteria bacterium]|jgi:hypothetical protein